MQIQKFNNKNIINLQLQNSNQNIMSELESKRLQNEDAQQSGKKVLKLAAIHSKNQVLASYQQQSRSHSVRPDSRSSSKKEQQNYVDVNEFEGMRESTERPTQKMKISSMIQEAKDLQRIRPKQIIYDQEQTYDDNLYLKQKCSYYKQENFQLKTKIFVLEKTVSKLHQMLQDLPKQNDRVPTKETNPRILAMNFKRSNQQLREDLKDANIQIDELKKDIKLTNVKEIESELQIYIDETLRLRAVLDLIQNPLKLSNNQGDLMNMVQKLYQQNNILNSEKMQIEEKLELEQVKYEQAINKSVKLNIDLQNVKKLYQEQSKVNRNNLKEISKLREQLVTQNDDKKSQVSLNQNPENDYSTQFQLKQKDQIISYQEKKISDQITELAILRKQYDEENKLLTEKLQKITIQNSEQESKYKTLLKIHHQLELQFNKKMKGRKETVGDYDDEDTEVKEKGNQPATTNLINTKRLKVKSYEVEEIAKIIILKMNYLKIPFDKLMETIFTQEIIEQKQISIKQMNSILTTEPIGLKIHEQVELLSRFLIEDQDQTHIRFDENNSQDINIVKSTFRKFLNSYQLPSQEQIEQEQQIIKQFFIKFGKSLQNYCQNLTQQKGHQKGYCKAEFITQHIQIYVDSEIHPCIFNNILAALTSETMTLNDVRIMKIFETFDYEKYLQEKND